MEQEKVNTENGDSGKKLVDEVNNLIKQVDSIKKKMEESFPVTDGGIKDYKSYIEGLSKQIGELQQDKNDEKEIMLHQKRFDEERSCFLVFLGMYAFLLLVFAFLMKDEFHNVEIMLSLILGGIFVILIMAVIVILFAYKTKNIIIQKKE